jgi:hypothetical protein
MEAPVVVIVKKLGASEEPIDTPRHVRYSVDRRNRDFASSLPFVYATSHTSPSANDDAPLVNPLMCRLAKLINPF